MDLVLNLIQKFFIFEKEPQRIGLSQFKKNNVKPAEPKPSLKNKEVKLSDLMRKTC